MAGPLIDIILTYFLTVSISVPFWVFVESEEVNIGNTKEKQSFLF